MNITAKESMEYFAWLCLAVGIPYLLWSLWIYCLDMARFMGLEQKEALMTEDTTTLVREQKLDLYEDALSAFSTMTEQGMPVNVSLRSPDFQEGYRLAIEIIAGLADAALDHADAMTGDRVDMTAKEKLEAERAVAVINSYTEPS